MSGEQLAGLVALLLALGIVVMGNWGRLTGRGRRRDGED